MPRRARSLPFRAAALAVLAFTCLLLPGCGSEERPPATIREYMEPTETVDQLVEEPQSEETSGPLSPELRRQLEKQVQLINVAFAADGGYLIVNFKAPPRLAVLWQPGELHVVDQATGAKYDNIPFMPKIGRLIGRPVQDGQPGYVMLENRPPLKPGAKVTVVLDAFTKTDVIVEEAGMPVP